MKNPTAELIERARKYMAKRYGRDMQATEDGTFFYMAMPAIGPSRTWYRVEVGYVCADGSLVDGRGDRDEVIARLN